jgi:uncharacterized protein
VCWLANRGIMRGMSHPTYLRQRWRVGAAALLLLVPLLAAAAPAAPECGSNSYRLADGRVLDVARRDDGTLRWRDFSGNSGELKADGQGAWRSSLGWTGRPDGISVSFGACAGGRLRFAGVSGERIDFDVSETRFASGGVQLAGRLLLPRGREPLTLVVLLHGAEHDSAREVYALQRLLPAVGVGAFVYDKRGTGDSGGSYTQDYSVLADDAVAALREARRLAGARVVRSGFQAGSQGGWVAPLAATRVPVDFVIVCFGLAVTPIEEDQEEVALEMRLKGHSEPQIAQALEVATAAENLISSSFTSGFEQFDAVRARYRNEPWYPDLHGNYTYMLLPYSAAELREKGKAYVFGTPWHYDSLPPLRAVTAPQLWILGEDDLEAPSAETARRLHGLQQEGRPITVALYPHAEHGMTEYELDAHGERLSTRYAPGYFAMMRDFARDGRLHGRYGAAVVTLPGR